ncbi:unnamed protein product [Ceutorhynchus assimilis]|uniref:BAT2 N-terminal domain-containing protein n=1 Tax=Ceutorhynchus assimilis TaxID=467358 RepID=A0A9N9MXH8_9CUCU|nr:unnamed protein product [Ceutorhynchus assimilis]
MSTLSGNVSKGEKTKPKFQSLDINNLYKISRGENTEKPAQKSSSNYIKHGMQSLGKVPNARRAPANLPSLKSEHIDSGAAVPLVPPGSTGWGKQQEQGGTPAPVAQQNGTSPSPQGVQQQTVQSPPQLTSHQQAIAIPSTNVIPPHNKQTPHPAPAASTSGGDKLWSAVMAGGQPDNGHPPVYQSPQFQHEFPSLSAGDGAGGATGNRQSGEYAGSGGANQSGLSLRPQTEGSWTQGGQRPAQDGSVRSGSVPQGAPPQLPGQAGRQPEIMPPQMRGVLPPFMYKGSFPQNGPQTGQVNHPHSTPYNGRSRAVDNRPPRLQDRDVPTSDELAPRPIIKEEELSKLDEIGHDMGWAGSDDVDYNQKLAFSDDEDRPSGRKDYNRQPSQHKQQAPQSQAQQQPKSQDVRSERQTPPKHWNSGRSENYRGRQSEEDEAMSQKHRQHQKEVDLAIQRAKQRKEEEEKRFSEESRQRAQKKLQELNEKVREKRDRDRETEIGTISPSAVPPKPINHVEIPLPEFQKDKEKEQRPRGSQHEVTPPKEDNNTSGFRQMTQIEGKSFSRKPQQKFERDHREQNGPNFSKHFQNDLPPRFLKNQQRNTGSTQNPSQSNYSHYEPNNRWSSNAQRAPSRGARPDSPERHNEDHREYRRQSSDDSYRSSHHSQSESTQKPSDNRYSEESYSSNKRDEDKWQKEPRYNKPEVHDRHYEDRRSQEKSFERPQRPDSRDSHTSHTSHTSHGSQSSISNRRSRDIDLKESMGSWNEDVEAAYEEKKEKERLKDEKRTAPALLVPGPITRDRIEADDFNEKRNLTQLKKGEMPPPKKVEVPKKDDKARSNEKLAWAESVTPAEEVEHKKEPEAKPVESKKPQQQHDDYKDRQNRTNRSYSQSKSWGSSGSSSDFHSRGPSWGNKQRPPSRGHKLGGRDFYSHGTDSDGSTDTYPVDSKDSKIIPKKPFDKEEKNRDNRQEKTAEQKKPHPQSQQAEKVDKKDGSGYVPRGEPSRHGRGGANNFRGSRMGGMGKRIDGYGPPPSKSPFGHHEDKKTTTEETSVETSKSSFAATDKIKQNQEALSAGIIGRSRQESSEDKNKAKLKPDNRRNKKDEEKDNTSDLSDSSKRQPISRSSSQRGIPNNERRVGNDRRNNPPPPRTGGEKRGFEAKKADMKPDPQNLLASAIADITLKNRDDEVKEQKGSSSDLNGDSEGFQEVKSKKTTKERPKEEKKGPPLARNDTIKDAKLEKKPLGKPSSTQMTQQQIQNIPPLMSTPVNPPQMLPNKNQYDSRDQRSNNRQHKLPPRFAKQKMQKQMQQQMMNDISGDLNKVQPQGHAYGMRDNVQTVLPAAGSAWDKPLGPQLRPSEHDASVMLGVSLDGVNLDPATPTSGHGASPGGDKALGIPSQIPDKNLLDGTTPPVNTIIFENTNFKSAPGVRTASRNSIPGGPTDKPRSKLDENLDNSMFTKPINDLLQKCDGKDNPIQMVFKEESDIKLDFFGADLTHLTEDKSSQNLCMSKSITSVNSTICNADSLNMKIASVKKVWETSEQENEDTSGLSFGAPLDTAFKGSDPQDEAHHEGFSPGSNQAASSTNVCKVKPTQQVSSAAGQTVSSTSQQPHSAIVGHPMLLGTQLSPPPMAATAVGVSLGPQAFATNQHLTGFPSAASAQGVAAAGSAQYGISAIPSPPTVLYNSTQQLQSGLYGAFLPTADQGVLGGQGHARAGGFGQYPAAGAYHSLGQPTNSPYNTQSVYLPTPPHPPPTAQAPPELYPSMNSFRLSAANPFGQNQPLNNPTTMLISSTSNSLMSASVKPSSQPISAIGTKAGGVGQAYQQQSQQGQQVYMTYEPALQAANYLPGAGVMQRGPGGPPVQNSVVPGLQPSSSYYSGSTGGQTGYYQQGNSSLPSAPQMPQHQAGYGLQGNVFGTHSQSHTNTGLQGSYPFLSTSMQMAAALNAQQQFRSAAASLQNPYMKNVGGGGTISGDQQSQQTSGGQRPQQLKSPSSQEVLSSVFNSGLFITAPQIPSPKSRQNSKHTPQQSSPTTQRKYFYQNVGSQQNNVYFQVQQRYPPPIQRPVNFQQQNLMQNNSSGNPKHNNRNNSNKAPNRQYYGGQSSSLPTNHNDKSEDSKTPDPTSQKSVNADLAKDNLKDDSTVLKE